MVLVNKNQIVCHFTRLATLCYHSLTNSNVKGQIAKYQAMVCRTFINPGTLMYVNFMCECHL